MKIISLAATLLISFSINAKSSLETIVHCKQAQIVAQGDEVTLLAAYANVTEVKEALKKSEDFTFSGLIMWHANRQTVGGFDRYYKNVTFERKGSLVTARKQVETGAPVEFAELTLEEPGALVPNLSVGNSETSYGVQLICTFED